MLPRVAMDATLNNLMALSGLLEENKVDIRTGVKLEAVTDNGVIIIDKDWERTEIACDTVVCALGVSPRVDAAQELAGLAPEVFVVGDCARERGNLWQATTGGFDAAMEI
jgi:NADH dehydrogenase FAD-containing subunit